MRTEEAFLECLANMNRSNVNCLPVCNLYQANNMNVVLSNHSVLRIAFLVYKFSVIHINTQGGEDNHSAIVSS